MSTFTPGQNCDEHWLRKRLQATSFTGLFDAVGELIGWFIFMRESEATAEREEGSAGVLLFQEPYY